VILAKLDSSARGGMAFAIQKELNLPILFAGLGEKPEDLQPFSPEDFVEGILADFKVLSLRAIAGSGAFSSLCETSGLLRRYASRNDKRDESSEIFLAVRCSLSLSKGALI